MNYRKPTFWIILTAVVVCVIVAVCFLTNPRSNEIDLDQIELSKIIQAGVDIESPITHNGDMLTIMDESGKPWYFEEGQEVDIGVRFTNDGSSMSSHKVGYVYCGESTEGIYAEEIYSTQTVTESYGSFEVPQSGNYFFVFGNFSSSWIELDGFFARIRVEGDYIPLGIAQLVSDNAGYTEIILRNLHNGQESTVTDSADIDRILDFISVVEGTNPTSSKGYYGGSYEVQVMNGTETVFSIGFGDDETFNHGDFGDGYPARYELRGVSREDVLRFFRQFDSSNFDWGLGIPGSTYEIYNVAPLEELPDTYNLEEATIDKCVIIVDGDIRDNADVWEAFIGQVNAGEKASVRIVMYYHGSETEPSSMYVHELTYDGTSYQIRWFEDGKEYIEKYQYLRYFSGEAESESAEYDAYVRYVLTDNLEASWKELFLSYASSVYGAAIPHFAVYTDLIYYPDYPEIPAVLTGAELMDGNTLVAAYKEEEMLCCLQQLLSSAEALDSEPKTYGICCNLILTGTDGSTVELGLDAESDYFVLNGVFYDYGPGYDDDGCLDATKDLLTLLGLDKWP